jgi:hypothetical protein
MEVWGSVNSEIQPLKGHLTLEEPLVSPSDTLIRTGSFSGQRVKAGPDTNPTRV